MAYVIRRLPWEFKMARVCRSSSSHELRTKSPMPSESLLHAVRRRPPHSEAGFPFSFSLFLLWFKINGIQLPS